MVAAAHWRTPIPAFWSVIQTSRVDSQIELASSTTDFHNQMASHYILRSQQHPMIELWILIACESIQLSGVLNI